MGRASGRSSSRTRPSTSEGAYWSPDGTRLAYHKWHDDPDLTARTHLVLADGTGDTVLEPDSVWNAVFGWSNDGTRLAMVRGYNGGYDGARMVAIPVDGSGPGVEMQYAGDQNPECCAAWAWAPDDSTHPWDARRTRAADPLAAGAVGSDDRRDRRRHHGTPRALRPGSASRRRQRPDARRTPDRAVRGPACL